MPTATAATATATATATVTALCTEEGCGICCNNNDDDDDAEKTTTTTTVTTIVDRKRKISGGDDDEVEQEPPSSQSSSTPRPTPKFTVTYSRLCDGGTQEMSTAVACVREIFPDASITTTRRQPVEDAGIRHPSVVISVSSDGDSNGESVVGRTTPGRRRSSASSASMSSKQEEEMDFVTTLWSAEQKNLYEKYPKKRRRSIKNIRKSLSAFRKELLELENDIDDVDDDDDDAAATTTTKAGPPIPASGEEAVVARTVVST